MPKILILISLLLVWGMLFSENAGLISASEKEQLIQMLESAGLDSTSLCFEKDWSLSTRFKLDWQLRQLQNPWQAMEDLEKLRSLCAGDEASDRQDHQLLSEFGGIAFNLDPAAFGNVYLQSRQAYDDLFGGGSSSPKELFELVEKSLAGLRTEYGELYSHLSAEDVRSLLSFFIWSFIEAEDTRRYTEYFSQHGLPEYEDLDEDEIYARLSGIDLESMMRLGLKFQALAEAVVDASSRLEYRNKKPLIRKTDLGLMVIGTPGDDYYGSAELASQPVCLMIDPGGNDVYEASLAANPENPFYIMVDLAGDDIYRNAEPLGMFNSSFGYGLSFDGSGNDLYQTGDFAFASFAGFNLHRDICGDDVYRGGLFSQGAAMFGVSILNDEAGNDIYEASLSAQGFGSTHGVGALLDASGADTYALGGKYFHEPLMPLDYITLGQGMGLGLRPDLAGGLGFLYDGSGNDRYLGGVYAQGSGYWYATGLLIDEAGNDVYNTIYYPQGSGIHLACGFLLDKEGDDAYYSRHGPGQGAGHDWSFGMFIDEAGNDAYSIQGGNGLGLTNSVGIFIDKIGDDRYERNEGQNFGNANLSRSTGGIGLFLDAGGKDTYPDSLHQNDDTWQKGTYGIGRDIDLNQVGKTDIEELAEAAALPDSTDSIEDIFAAASEWEVGSAVQRVRRAREILLFRADEAIDYILQNKMNTLSGLEYRALEALARDSGHFVTRLFPVMDDPDSLAAKNAISLISAVGDTLLVDHLQRLLRETKYETACLSALGGINSPLSVELLRAYIDHPSERFRYIAARSLKQIKHPLARETLMLMAEDPSFLVQALIRNLPPEVTP
ncbi:MAG: HEAT repeat domain-containing protein [Candidatus Syntrophosphaera sp.]